MKVAYTTAGTPGIFRKKVFISTNIPSWQNIDIFTIRGEVLEAPGAKIAVTPRRIILEGAERSSGKKQVFTITNEGALPLVVRRIRSKDGARLYFNGEQAGNLTIEPGQRKELEIRLEGNKGDSVEREYILVDSNARNTGEAGLIILVQYGK